MSADEKKRRRKTVHPKGIFCLEGEWSRQMARTSTVEPILKLLRKWDPYYVPYIHRDVATRAEFDFFIGKWLTREMDRFPILYLAFHGEKNSLLIGESRKSENHISLDELADRMEGRCHKRIIYFGSCGTLALHGNSIHAFLRQTGALAVCGYRYDVDWLSSTAFEVIALGAMQELSLTRRGATAVRKRIAERVPALARKLQFHMVVGP